MVRNRVGGSDKVEGHQGDFLHPPWPADWLSSLGWKPGKVTIWQCRSSILSGVAVLSPPPRQPWAISTRDPFVSMLDGKQIKTS